MPDKVTRAQVAEWKALAEKATPRCPVCMDGGTISVRHGTSYETDTAAERAASYHNEKCPHCGNFLAVSKLAVPVMADLIERLAEALKVEHENHECTPCFKGRECATSALLEEFEAEEGGDCHEIKPGVPLA
jgi:hypothetical protein